MKIKENIKILRGTLFTIIGGICWGFSGACGQLIIEQIQHGLPLCV
jgi:hypothetical protein